MTLYYLIIFGMIKSKKTSLSATVRGTWISHEYFLGDCVFLIIVGVINPMLHEFFLSSVFEI